MAPTPQLHACIDRLRLAASPASGAHFETSFGRSYGPHVRARQRPTTGRTVSANASPTTIRSTAAKRPRRPGTSSPISSRRACWVTASSIRARSSPALRTIRGHRMAKAAVEMAAWDLYARQLGQPLVAGVGRHRSADRSGVSIGIQDSLDELEARVESSSPPGTGASRSRSSRAGTWTPVERLRDALRRHPADGRRQRRIHARRRRPSGDARRVRSDDDRAAARLRRHRGARYAAARLETPICLDESIHSARARGGGDRGRRVPDHQHQTGPGRRARRVDPGARRLRRARRAGLARRHARERASAAPTTFTCPRCRISRCPGTSRRAAVTTRRIFIEPPIEVRADGTIDVPPGPGIGVHVVADRVERATERTLSLTHP